MLKKRRTRRPGFWGALNNIWRQFLRYAVTGMIAWVPLIVTVWVVRLLINNPVLGIERLVRNMFGYIRAFGERVEWLGFLAQIQYRPGIGLLTALMIFLATGLLTQYLLGRRLISSGERLLQRIPLISRIYRAVQQIRDVFLGRGGGPSSKKYALSNTRGPGSWRSLS